MVLTDREIRTLAQGQRLIEPFDEDKLQSESYDISIGDQITIFRKEIRCLDISEQEAIDNIYEIVKLTAEGYVISPKEYILVSLRENICLPSNVTAHIKPKTRYTRLGLLVSDQHCNSTYNGKLSIGLFNATEYPIRIRKGYTIAQLIFEELVREPSENKQYKNKKNSHYQNEREFRGSKFDDILVEKVMKELFE